MSSSNDDAQRDLEQRALRNVHSLAHRLGYADAIDRYGERFVLLAIGIVIFFVFSAVALNFTDPARDPKVVERQRCALDTAVVVVDEMRTELKARQPQLSKGDLERRVMVTNTDVKQEAALRCAARGL